MTEVHPNHIVGINSITVQTGDSLSVHKTDGSLIRTIVSNTGVSTFHAIEVSKGGGDLSVGVSTFFVDNSTGQIGIGTDNPTRELTIYSPDSGSTYINLTNATTGTTTGDGFGIGLSGDEAAKLWNYENSYMAFATNATEKLRITSAGLVGIGTDNPLHDLEVYKVGAAVTATSVVRGEKAVFAIMGDAGNSGASETDARLVFSSDGDTNPSKILTSPLASHGFEIALINEEPGAGLRFHDGSAGAERLRISSAGLIGIGTATPSVALDLVRSKVPSSDRNTDDAITIENNGTTNINIISATDNAGFILFSDDERAKGYMKYTHGSNILSFKTNGSEHLVIGSGGDLTLTGDEGISANLYLVADQGDDNGDGWRVGSNQDVNDLTLANNTSGSYVDKMRLSKEGYPTFPSLPAFSAKNSAGADYTSGAQILYPNEDFDRNGDYTAASSYFTAPIAGIYFVSWSVKGTGSSNTTVYANCQVSTNDGVSWSQRGPALEFSSDISSEHTGMAAIINLGADDRVRIGSATNARVDASDHFAMCLIG